MPDHSMTTSPQAKMRFYSRQTVLQAKIQKACLIVFIIMKTPNFKFTIIIINIWHVTLNDRDART